MNGYKDFLEFLNEQQIAKLFDELKENYGRDIFGQGYIYRLIEDSELADIDTLTEDEKRNGISADKKYYVPYDKGDKDGNRWYLETPFAIAWSKENVRYLKTDAKAKYQGYMYFFREDYPFQGTSEKTKDVIGLLARDLSVFILRHPEIPSATRRRTQIIITYRFMKKDLEDESISLYHKDLLDLLLQ